MSTTLPPSHPSLGAEQATRPPRAKKPKWRAPHGIRDSPWIPGKTLPAYTGPYPVGTMEIELETVLMTIYYPAAIDQEEKLPQTSRKFSRELWLGRPRLGIAQGYSKFAGLGNLGIGLMATAMFTKLPAFRNAPLATYWAPAVDTQSEDIKATSNASFKPSEEASEEPVFPVIIFSHGLGGTRTMYSSICGELSSYGHIVVAIEHRDGSGPRTYVNYPKQGEGSMADLEARGELDHLSYEREQGYTVIDYVFPKDNPLDTSPRNESGVDTELRDAQKDLRLAEVEEAIAVLREIVSGNGNVIAQRNLRVKGHKGGSSHGLQTINWARWKGRARLDHVTVAGHSFGGDTVVDILRRRDRFTYVSQGIIYDIWGAGTRLVDADERPDDRVSAPLLAINSEAFTYWPQNFELVESIVKEAESEPWSCPAWLMTIRGTVHISQSDFSLLYRNVCSLFLKMTADPQRALDLNINASLEFLNQVLPKDMAMVNRAFDNEKLLEQPLNPLERIATNLQHKPKDEKWLAARLRIPHEWLYRLSPKLFRHLRRAEDKRQGKEPEPGDEVWLHHKPAKESVEKYLERTTGKSKADVKEHETAEGTEDAEPMQLRG
ncbi:hypothetical protein CKM354_000304500 [Cercospora kikuchii]|uniref:1-alkyl-2-acetylglycerophosphocholine esterase n=1 Tax=Cercospora kikuchii TaxID=84275 RepID=A0A9P3CGX1_9PEZI|nr:uncharacterized protein CKM354_000304500 [Cercospora kikuchii]GIZ39670.1 hypothetical protein CKM354_000304500 [Cercospora kikuchii]